jgi:hypothetical protein
MLLRQLDGDIKHVLERAPPPTSTPTPMAWLAHPGNHGPFRGPPPDPGATLRQLGNILSEYGYLMYG